MAKPSASSRENLKVFAIEAEQAAKQSRRHQQ
jgi:hypothetical protein